MHPVASTPSSALRATLIALACATLCPDAALRAAPKPGVDLPVPAIKTAPATMETLLDSHRFEDLFAPFRTDTVALSPDGKLLAYTVHEKDELYVCILPIDAPKELMARLLVLTDELATPMMQARSGENTPARLRWLCWVTPTRLVFETNRVFPYTRKSGDWANASGEIIAVDADGKNPRSLANPRAIRRPFENRVNSPTASALAAEAAAPAPSIDDPLANIRTQKNELMDIDESRGGEPATLRVIGLHPTAADQILLRTEGRTFKVYEANVLTGEIRQRSEETSVPNTLTLLDRLGRPRVSVVTSFRAAFPRTFVLEPATLTGQRRALSEQTEVPGFAIAPESYFGTRAVPLGFDDNPDILYYASNVGRDTYGFYALDLTTGKRTIRAIETPAFDLYRPQPGTFGDAGAFGYQGEATGGSSSSNGTDPFAAALAAAAGDADDPDPNRPGSPDLVHDRYRHTLAGIRFEGLSRSAVWLVPELRVVQGWLATNLPGQTAEIIDWDQAMERVLVLVRRATDAGAYHLLDLKQKKFMQFVRRAPALDENAMAATTPFVLPLADGTRIEGVLSLPRETRLKPVPLAVLCPTWPWELRGTEYSRDFDVLARMGIAVVQFNGRGIWGGGLRQRAALKAGYEEAQIADIVAVVQFLAARHGVSNKRVALVGRGHGGFVALRALQLHPGVFRCAVTLDALVDLGAWLETSDRDQASFGAALTREMLGDAARLKAAPLVRHPEMIRGPVFSLAYRGDTPAQKSLFLANKHLNSSVANHVEGTEFFELEPDHAAMLPKAVADQWRRIELFLNNSLYNYRVDVGSDQILPDAPDSTAPRK